MIRGEKEAAKAVRTINECHAAKFSIILVGSPGP
jgi:hypothetical protein